jgi:hypothetical protein
VAPPHPGLEGSTARRAWPLAQPGCAIYERAWNGVRSALPAPQHLLMGSVMHLLPEGSRPGDLKLRVDVVPSGIIARGAGRLQGTWTPGEADPDEADYL